MLVRIKMGQIDMSVNKRLQCKSSHGTDFVFHGSIFRMMKLDVI